MFVVPKFTFFVTGDLAFYTDSFGKHSSCSFGAFTALRIACNGMTLVIRKESFGPTR
jgi:hypothetical protein